MVEKIDSLISVVTVLDNDQDLIEPFLRQTSNILSKHFTDYEIILIDQRSKDGSLKVIQPLLSSIPFIRLVELSKGVDKDIALAAGLENAIGDFIIFLDIRHDPVDIIPHAVAQCYHGSDVVIGVAKHAHTFLYRLLRTCVNKLLINILNYDLPRNATEFRCLSRRAANAVTRTGRFRHSFFIKIAQTGYQYSTLKYSLSNLQNRRTLLYGISKAMKMLVYNSAKPLRWISVLGCAGSFTALVFSLYSLVIHFIKNNVAEGWTTLVLFISILFFLLFVVLTIFGEYLGRMLDSFKTHYEYDILFEKNSSVKQETNRYNVMEDSVCEVTNSVQTGRNK